MYFFRSKKLKKLKKISINTKTNLRETRAIAAVKKNPKYFHKFLKNNSAIRAGIGHLRGTWNQATEK